MSGSMEQLEGSFANHPLAGCKFTATPCLRIHLRGIAQSDFASSQFLPRVDLHILLVRGVILTCYPRYCYNVGSAMCL